MDISMLIPAFLMGVVAGLRAMMPLEAISWAASRKSLDLEGSWLAFLGAAISPYIFGLAALGELVGDKLPKTPSRKSPASFIFRVLIGFIAGLALTKMSFAGGIAGAAGAVCGTLGGYEVRMRLVRMLGCPDWPVALVEDIIAAGGAFLIVSKVG